MKSRFERPEQHSWATAYQCPICTTTLLLQSSGRQFACQNGHHFDLAKEGYLNLLPVQYKSSLSPGDNKQMMVARRAFLEAGHYAQMAQAAVEMLQAHYSRQYPLRLLDLGCGEGYYGRIFAAAMHDQLSWQLHGLDIAKFAIAAAAKKQADAKFVVASVNRLPYSDGYFDALLRVFAPSRGRELLRVLKPDGLLLAVTPGPRHLWQLKAFIYPEVHEHPIEPPLVEGFNCIASERVQYSISPSPEHRIALLHMTPFAWHAHQDVQQAVKAMHSLEIEVDFCLALNKKMAH